MGLLDEIIESQSLVEEAKNTIKKVYQEDQRPWVIGYSGGKDSTSVLQLVIESMIEMKNDNIDLNKIVYVISSDTMVETPLIISSLGLNLKLVQVFADKSNLPIKTQLVRPALNDTFWVNLIGKGYPAPNQSFRWCTDRMKIEPSNRFIKDKVSEHGEVIVLLGVRETESVSRGNSIKSHTIEGKEIMRHSTLANAFTFAPIKKFTVDDVWDYLLSNKSPWGADNEELFKLYADSNANECPLIIDQETKNKAGSCGNSRFGCWVCTVVNEDKALTGFVENGETWLRPLLRYRNWLTKHRDDRNARMKMRANGKIYTVQINHEVKNGTTKVVIPQKGERQRIEIYIKGNKVTSSINEKFDIVKRENLNEYLIKNNIDVTQGKLPNFIIKEDDHYSLLGLGPYTFEHRKEMIKRLLLTQQELANNGHPVTIITDDELREIRREWRKRGLIEDSLPQIYASVFNKDLSWEENDIELLTSRQMNKLNQLCSKNGLYLNPLVEMLRFEQEQANNKKKQNASTKIAELLTKDYLNI